MIAAFKSTVCFARADTTYLERLGGERLLGERRRRDLLGERLDLLGERRLRLLKLLLRLSGLLALFFPLQRAASVTKLAGARRETSPMLLWPTMKGSIAINSTKDPYQSKTSA